MSRARRSLMILAAGLLAALALPAGALAASCTGDPSSLRRLDLVVDGQPASGLYALPAQKPRGLVVFGHGYSYDETAWRGHMIRAASRDGLVAVTMGYRGLRHLAPDATGFPRSRGWPVQAGAEDLVAAGRHFDAVCGGFDRRFLLGISMGGNSTGLAAAMAAKTADGRPLFDYWIGIEGVWNLTELYQQASAVAATSPFAAQAKQDIEAETGGTLAQRPAAYAQRTVVARAPDIGRAGLRGIVLVHAQDDGEASYDQAQQMERAMRGQSIPTDLYTVSRKRPDDTPDTTLSGSQVNAGHAPEWSMHHIVLDTGFDALSGLAAGTLPPPCNRDVAVDGAAGTAIPDPRTVPPGCAAAPTFSGTSRGQGGGQPARPCTAGARPRVTLTLRRGPGRGRLVVRGTATDRGCAGLGGFRLAVARRDARGGCRFVRTRSGRLTARRRACTATRTVLRPRGRSAFRLTLRHLRPGRYRVTALARDRKGHTGHRTKSLRVR